ncbi:MAG: GTP 3',8-cyclase MoaA [Eudoraea sp.]|nr:GTP 3',8-cyclase MoaA [Eudoraea sp.]
MIQDSHHRTLDYVRVAITDRCNLRCFYCMPKEGIPYEPKAHLLSYEEIVRLLRILGDMGFRKVRFTGGEPFLRKDFVKLLEKTASLGAYDSINITTNGTLVSKHIDTLKRLGVRNINLSLDTLDPERFKKITRRNNFDTVMQTFHSFVEEGFKLKINSVIMHGVYTEDILPLAELAREYPVSVRFIEEMPFNGGYKNLKELFTARDIFQLLQNTYPNIQKDPMGHGETANRLNIDGFKGDLGIIAAFSRTFCNTCNRLRITPKGSIKTCLYDGGVFSMRDFMRSGATDGELQLKFQELIRLKPKDGFEAEAQKLKSKSARESMSTIGG